MRNTRPKPHVSRSEPSVTGKPSGPLYSGVSYIVPYGPHRDRKTNGKFQSRMKHGHDGAAVGSDIPTTEMIRVNKIPKVPREQI